jgi:hypothetical protein
MGRFVILVVKTSTVRSQGCFLGDHQPLRSATQTKLCTISRPATSIQSRAEDRDAGRFVASRIVIDACRPYRWLKEFPATNVMSRRRKKTIRKWRRALKPQTVVEVAELAMLNLDETNIKVKTPMFKIASTITSAHGSCVAMPIAGPGRGLTKSFKVLKGRALTWWTTDKLDRSRILERFEKNILCQNRALPCRAGAVLNKILAEALAGRHA